MDGIGNPEDYHHQGISAPYGIRPTRQCVQSYLHDNTTSELWSHSTNPAQLNMESPCTYSVLLHPYAYGYNLVCPCVCASG